MPRFFASNSSSQGITIQQAIQALQEASQVPPPQVNASPAASSAASSAQGNLDFQGNPSQVSSTQRNTVGNGVQVQGQAKRKGSRRQASRLQPYEQVMQFN